LSLLIVLAFFAAVTLASDEAKPHATENTTTEAHSSKHKDAGHEANAHGEEHKGGAHDENDIYVKDSTGNIIKDESGTRKVDAGKLFNNILHHLEDTYELHFMKAHVGLPVMFTDDHGFHFFSSMHALEESGEYKLKNLHKYEEQRKKSQFFWTSPWERVDGGDMGFTLDLSLTANRAFMLLTALILIIVISMAGKRAKTAIVPKGLHNVVESLVVYVRDEIVYPNVDKKWADKFMSFFLTVFFFIFTMNLLGLFPLAKTPTGAISVTMALALCTFVLTQIAGLRAMGAKEYFKHFTGGLLEMELPLVMKVILICIMVPIEFIGLFTKPFALMVRLFANMTAGHIVIGSLIGLAILFQSVIAGFAVSVPFALFIYLLELLVAFLQAYVFTMLSSVFIGMMAHEHHEEHGEGHGDEHGEPAHAH
jgi:F-type H+-transporting ATPase subunit a